MGTDRIAHNSWGYVRAMGRSSYTIECPFCKRLCIAYVWSIAGGGKLCTCGAKHYYDGTSKAPAEEEDDGD